MTFTKGLEHHKDSMLVRSPPHVGDFRRAIDTGLVANFNAISRPRNLKIRQWEAPTAGFVHDLEGPDSQAVTMPPAPALGSDELTYEMAEVYELALLRDVKLSDFSGNLSNPAPKVKAAIDRLNNLEISLKHFDISKCRRKRLGAGQQLIPQNLFREAMAGVTDGPYLSQFLLMGSKTLQRYKPKHGATNLAEAAGFIKYGPQTIDQRVPVAVPQDYMYDEASYLDVQDGYDVRDDNVLFGSANPVSVRFIQTPRDLATYVHDDALYQAYLSACLILLSQGAPFDPSFDELSGMGSFSGANTGGFALWGPPHILTLVTEVATRALKAVRFQKFNIHLRLRPEALAARIHIADTAPAKLPRSVRTAFEEMKQEYDQTRLLKAVKAHTAAQQGGQPGTLLLPMAFQEGSPMHPSYGAGHAAVAGACVTVLKAFFDTSAVLVEDINPNGQSSVRFEPENGQKVRVYFEVDPHVSDGYGANSLKLSPPTNKKPLTLLGELNKLAMNVSIGRNMAGVHYFSDHYDSLRLGEEVAIGILEEQALTYPKDRFVMSLTKFDGGTIKIG